MLEYDVTILYTNHAGETRYRNIRPRTLFFGSTPWHKEQQWLLEALDLEKIEQRTFAMKDIKEWITSCT